MLLRLTPGVPTSEVNKAQHCCTLAYKNGLEGEQRVRVHSYSPLFPSVSVGRSI